MTVDQRRACRNKEENVLYPKGEQVAATDCNDSAVTRQLPSFDNPFIKSPFSMIF